MINSRQLIQIDSRIEIRYGAYNANTEVSNMFKDCCTGLFQ